MSHRSRLTGPARWVILALTGGLLAASVMTVAVVSRAPQRTIASEVASSTPAPGTAPADALYDGFDIPASTTDAERQRIKLSYDIVSVPFDQRDRLLAVPGVTTAGRVSIGDVFYAAVPRSESASVRALIPEASVTPNPVVRPAFDQSPVGSWGLDAGDNTAAVQDGHYLYDSTGAGTTIFIVDTGVWAAHPDFGGRVDAAAGKNMTSDGGSTDDCNGHGTMVAGVAASATYGVAKEARIIPVRVFPCTGPGDGWDVIAALGWISDNFAGRQAVVNLSLGTPAWSDLDNAANALVDKGFVVTVAAGNEQGDACNVSPARASKVIDVGSYDPTDEFRYDSNRGPCVAIFAPGGSVTSTAKGGGSGQESGTSLASPFVAGLAARLLQEHPSWAPSDVWHFLDSPAAEGHLTKVPANTPNLVAAIPGVPKIASVTTTATSRGIGVSWATNGIGAFASFEVAVTDTTTGRTYPVVVSLLRSSAEFTDVVAGHSYTVTVSGSARMPSGATVTTDPVTVAGP
ncbi:S8 family peptidase [Microbacterium sp. BH-3-3-3]|uniref:S8 family peptidase n=1 Tax=Microbacterium sp. BH-3-3-3 TaxID=1906742 RepID=UPI0011A05097|nr:S8 family peptidase [Microbacterium sp. BH-3-3-3]